MIMLKLKQIFCSTILYSMISCSPKYQEFRLVYRAPNDLIFIQRDLTNCEYENVVKILTNNNLLFYTDDTGNIQIEKANYGESIKMLMWTVTEEIECSSTIAERDSFLQSYFKFNEKDSMSNRKQ